MLVFQTEREMEDSLAVVWIRITLLPYFHSFPQVAFCLLETSATQIPQPRLVETAHVIGVTPQGLLVIIEGTPCSMPVLLQMESREIELVVGLCVGWR